MKTVLYKNVFSTRFLNLVGFNTLCLCPTNYLFITIITKEYNNNRITINHVLPAITVLLYKQDTET